MKLISLEVTVDTRSVRIVKFKDGLNLVTNKRGVGRSGNSVGKSTLSRVVDYLFLGSIDSIYIDVEFKKPNEKIESLLRSSNVEATLSFLGLDGRLHVISRNLCISDKDKLFYFDGRSIDEKEYQQNLQNFCFDVYTRRPSVRSLAPKFIRNDSHRMLNTTKFLDQHTSSKDYSELFLYLFGFQNTALLTEKRDAANLLARRKRNRESLNAMLKEQKPGLEVAKYSQQISELERDFLKFDYSPEYVDPVARLSEIQKQEDIFSESALRIKRKIDNIKKTVRILSQQGGNYLLAELKAIYEFAGVSIENVIQKFEDVLLFHDNLVSKKKQFLTIDLPELELQYLDLVEKLKSTHKDKIQVFADMRSTESINNITSKLKQLGELKVALGKLEGLIDQQRKATEDLAHAESLLAEILAKISTEIESVDTFENKFNSHFGLITQEIHAEQYEFKLNFNKETGVCAAEVNNTSSNPEGGKKKAEVIAFDFAYIYTIESTGIKRPRFVFHDGIEDIDQKQINDIFRISQSLPGQQIVSMLSDKLSDTMYLQYSSDFVLLLSEDDMFFGV